MVDSREKMQRQWKAMTDEQKRDSKLFEDKWDELYNMEFPLDAQQEHDIIRACEDHLFGGVKLADKAVLEEMLADKPPIGIKGGIVASIMQKFSCSEEDAEQMLKDFDVF